MDRRSFLNTAGLGMTAGTLLPEANKILQHSIASLGNRSDDEVARDEDFWFQVRHAFTIDRNQINLNSGSVSPAPRVVQEAMKQYLSIVHMSPSLWVDEMLMPQREMLRGRLSAMFGCNPEELAITRNTSESLQIVQMGLNLKAGDEVLTTTQDYPRMLTTWRQRERRDGIVLKTFAIPTPAESLDQLHQLFEENITPKTRVIHFCHITYTAGQIFPVKSICKMARERGIYTIVDGAHAFAQFPYNGSELGCDFYGTSLHKWLTAPFGTGFLYARKERIPDVWPLTAAPASMDNDIRKFEQIGTHPVSNRNAVGEAITFNESIGISRKAARLTLLRDRWMNQVKEIPGVQLLTSQQAGHACALGTMQIRGMGAQELTDRLQEEYTIHVRPRFVPNEWEGIRVTPNVFTTLEEVDSFARAIKEIADQ